jgi:hypothetical protein
MCFQNSFATAHVFAVMSKIQQINSCNISTVFTERNYVADSAQFVLYLVQTLIWFFWKQI